MRAAASLTSWIAALIAIVVILAAQDRVVSHEDFGGFVQAGMILVVLSAVGLVAGIAGTLLNLRPARPGLLIPLFGTAANAALLWYFAPPILGLYFSGAWLLGIP